MHDRPTTGYLKVKDWHRFQHYKGRRPTWIKSYLDLNTKNREFLMLHPYARSLLEWIWRETAVRGEWLPNEPVGIARAYLRELPVDPYKALSKHLRRHLSSLLTSGFLTISASKMLASESELEKELEKDPPIPPPVPIRTKRKRTPKKPPVSPYSTAFLEFWQAYPRKIGKGAAWKAWKVRKDRPANGDMLASLEAHKRSEQWTKDGGQFIPHPSTFLNQARWEDEPDAVDKEVWI